MPKKNETYKNIVQGCTSRECIAREKKETGKPAESALTIWKLYSDSGEIICTECGKKYKIQKN
jgi:predicted transcriptional regulator